MRELLEDSIVRVYRFALRLTGDVHAAQDITQETCLRAWQHRGRLKKPGAARVWLFRIAANLWRDELRRGGRRSAGTTELAQCIDIRGRSAEKVLQEREEIRRAIQIMDSLPARQRQVLYLCALEGLSNGEIASVLDISEGTVKTCLSLARKTMRKRIHGVESREPEESDEPTPTPV